jgi:hypothetical protein
MTTTITAPESLAAATRQVVNMDDAQRIAYANNLATLGGKYAQWADGICNMSELDLITLKRTLAKYTRHSI